MNDLPDTPTGNAGTEGRRRSGGSGGRLKRIALLLGGLAVGVVFAALAYVFLLPSPVNDQVAAYKNTRPPASVARVDGLVVKATGDKFVLQLHDHSSKTLFVRAPDRPYIDVQHAQSHASLGQPVRVYFKKLDGKQSVVFMEDSPQIF